MREEKNEQIMSINCLHNTHSGSIYSYDQDKRDYPQNSESNGETGSLPVSNPNRKIAILSDVRTIRNDISKRFNATTSCSPPLPPSNTCNTILDSVSGCVSDTGSISSSTGEIKKSSKKNAIRKTKCTSAGTGKVKKWSMYSPGPGVTMAKEDLKKWRKDARRVRNRESAAASRRKIKGRIEELECDLGNLSDKYQGALQRIAELEALVGRATSSPLDNDMDNESGGTSGSRGVTTAMSEGVKERDTNVNTMDFIADHHIISMNSRPKAVKIETTGDEFANKPLYYNSIPHNDSLQQPCCPPLTTDVFDQTLSLLPSSATSVAIPDTASSFVSSSSSSSSLCEVNNSMMVDRILVQSLQQQTATQIEPTSCESKYSKAPGSGIPVSTVIDPYSADEGIDYEDDELIDFLEQTFQC
jgi:hypothetical protein